MNKPKFGRIALKAGYRLPLQILRSRAGYYIGTASDEGPVSRESVEYYRDQNAAGEALENGTWTQRDLGDLPAMGSNPVASERKPRRPRP